MEYWEESEEEKVLRIESQREREEKRKQIKQEKLDKKKRQGSAIPAYIKGKKEGMAREQAIADKWNKSMSVREKKKDNVIQRPTFGLSADKPEAPATYGSELPAHFSTDAPNVQRHLLKESVEAKRQPNSGARWHSKGDITLEHALVEVKERGTLNGRGKKTISIEKEWLDKQAEEAFDQGKEFWYLAFAYKGDPDVFIIKPYDDEIELISELRRLQSENDALRSKLEETN